MPEIIIGFEGHRHDLNELTFDLFEAGMLREGLERSAPGNVTLVMKPMELRKGFGHAIVQIGLVIGDKAVLPVFLSWLYDKWKKAGEKPISIKIENHFYEFDAALPTKAIEEAVRKEKSQQH